MPGLSCSRTAVPEFFPIGKGADAVTDNDGALWTLRPLMLQFRGGREANVYRHELVRVANAVEEVAGSIQDRSSAGVEDRIRGGYGDCGGNQTACGYDGAKLQLNLHFDAVRGELFFYMRSYCQPATTCTGAYGDNWWLVRIMGLTPLFEIFDSYKPNTSSLGFRVPVMPEGMAAADHFDTYWGALTNPLDFTQAHPLQCGYPAIPPAVGDYLTVADSVPTPAPGQGVYYVTAATYQGQTRYGRKASGGVTSGRDPALLPTCSVGP